MKWLTPKQIATELGVDSGKVIAWIRSGQLNAVNVSNRGSGRPRWRIGQDELDAFLRRRQSHPAATPRRKQPRPVGKQYY